MKRSCHDYSTLRQRLRFLITDASRPQQNNLALFVFGLLAAWHVHLPKIALCLPVAGNLKNAQQRLERFLKNPAVVATAWYKGVARAVLARFAEQEIDLILDATDLADRHPMLLVALRYKGRAFPILWQMLPSEGCSAYTEQEALLQQGVGLLPPGGGVTLLADREYGSADLIRFCLKHGWHFVLRLKKNRWLRLRTGHAFQLFELPLRPGTDRFSIEERFGDFKEQGFRLDKTRLKATERVSRLVLCVCIAYVLALLLGEKVETHGLRRLVERAVKRQMSLFQIGLRYLKRLLVQGQDWTELLVLRI